MPVCVCYDFDSTVILSVGKMVLNRWFFPNVPDSGGEKYKYNRDSVYRGMGSVVGKGTKLEEDVLIGHR